MKEQNQINARSMRIYLSVLSEGSLSEVARQEGIAASSVSRTILMLEQALETQLLYRNTRAVVATDAGEVYARTFKDILEQLDCAQAKIGERRLTPGGRFRLNAPVSFGSRHIAPLVAELSTRYPDLRLELNLTDEFIDPLADSTDLIIRISPMKDSALHGRLIAKQTYHLVASPSYIENRGGVRDPIELSKHSLLAYKGKMGIQQWQFFRDEEKVLITPEPQIASDNAELLVRAAIDGAGVLLFPDWQVGELLKEGKLVKLMQDYDGYVGAPEQSIFMLYPGSKFPSLNTRVVIDFLVEKFGDQPYWKSME